MKRIFHWTAMILAATYLLLAALPTRMFFFDPGEVSFANAVEGTAPALAYSREIHIPTLIQYSTVTRLAGEAQPACGGNNGAGDVYQPANGPTVGKDLQWWSNNDLRCATLPPGDYWTSTTWTVVAPMRALLPEALKDTFLAWLLPPKHLTVNSPAFTIYPREEPKR